MPCFATCKAPGPNTIEENPPGSGEPLADAGHHQLPAAAAAPVLQEAASATLKTAARM